MATTIYCGKCGDRFNEQDYDAHPCATRSERWASGIDIMVGLAIAILIVIGLVILCLAFY